MKIKPGDSRVSRNQYIIFPHAQCQEVMSRLLVDKTKYLVKMTTEDKIRTMETIWEDLSKKGESIPSPSWHKDVLVEREKAIDNGKEKFIDWNEAKRQIKDAIS